MLTFTDPTFTMSIRDPSKDKQTMFTGIIEAVGDIRQIQPSAGRMRLAIDLKHLAEDARPGDSIAVNGVCLTVSSLNGTLAVFDVSSETVNRSTLSRLKIGSKVNLERAMSANGRFGGHIVQGHIDGTAKIAAIRKEADFAEFTFDVETKLLTQIVLKGSVAVDGISLTVSGLTKSGFSVSLIPTTLKETIWHNAKTGDLVNIETDILVKIIQKQIATILPQQELTFEKLKGYGF
jgi:riboflavin synthase